MAGLGVKLYTDEHIDPRLTNALRDRGYDVQSCQEAGRAGRELSDEQQLAYAAQQGRAILTFDSTDFTHIDRRWKATGRRHAGIIVSREIKDVGELLRRVQRHLDSIDPEVQNDTLLWLA